MPQVFTSILRCKIPVAYISDLADSSAIVSFMKVFCV